MYENYRDGRVFTMYICYSYVKFNAYYVHLIKKKLIIVFFIISAIVGGVSSEVALDY